MYGDGTRLQSEKLASQLASLNQEERKGLSGVALRAIERYEAKKGGKATVQSTEEAEVDMSVIPENMRHLSKTLLLKIQGRAKARSILRECPKMKAEVTTLESLPYLVVLLRGIFVSQKRTAMQLPKLLPLMVNRHKDKLPEKRYRELLDKLIIASPTFCSMKKSLSGTVIFKINTKMNTVDAYREIEAAKEKVKSTTS